MTLCHFLGAKVQHFESKITTNTFILITNICVSYLFVDIHCCRLTICKKIMALFLQFITFP